MIFSENRYPPRIKSGAGFFRIMLWRWFGYDNAWVVIDGAPVQSVTGGGHWGGGMFINAYDMARFGYLTLRRGKWGDRQLLSETWVSMALTPTGLLIALRIHELFPQHRAQAVAERARDLVHAQRQRPQHDLCRSRERPGRGGALDRQQRGRRLSQAADRGGGGEELGRSCIRGGAARRAE